MKKSTKAMIYGGLILLLAALALTGYYLFLDLRSAKSEEAALETLEEVISTVEPSAEQTQQAESETDSVQPAETDTEETPEPSQETEPAATEVNTLEGESTVEGSLLDTEMPTTRIDGQKYIGILEIPALDVSFPIISEWSYERLKLAPCRYSGSAYDGTMVIAGHNYASQFRNLKNLQAGDTVIFTDVDGNVFTYAVTAIEQLQPTAIEEMTTGDWDLTLFTCTVGAKARIAVRCDEASE